ncbi:pyocin knob domain-containing S74 family peptidase [Galbibacter pacificus]|uniref:Pyocin knob domain-containing S74 family peptidase n=1 Tax=Galbibacter pacificus TaxID=2996052 RepID=A0ABT6FR71_9FLAO|nr:pyocin knob domain-containing S74 family peptidase [Galbibacter pacificus]MDG3581768.1 pyocin knob domain-containing S74 family peptidase [Galbibacter pacificus]MDG3585758.1 pyocin knob domain-containing S74 family peptidase [Galbibacter pacificus]
MSKLIVNDINDRFFELNGIQYPKIFITEKIGDIYIKLINKYDRNFFISQPHKLTDYIVEGEIYSDLSNFQTAIYPIIFNPNINLKDEDVIRWNTGYNDDIVNASVTGTNNKTLTLTQRDGSTIVATWTDIDSPPDGDEYINALIFNPNNGVISAGRTGGLPDVTTSLDGRYSLLGHTHTTSDITNLTLSTLGGVPSSRTITAGTGLTGGGNLTGDRIISVDNDVSPLTATRIPASQDLNTYQNPGFWYQSANADVGSNYPSSYAGSFVVQKSAGVTQQYYQYNNDGSGGSPEMYIRSFYSGNWSSWGKVWHSENDGSGSGLDADTVDGLHANSGYATNARIPATDSNGYFSAYLLRQSYASNNTSVGHIMTQVETGTGNNYIRPTTPASFRAAVTDNNYILKNNRTDGGYAWIRRSTATGAAPLYVTQQSSGEIIRFYQGSGDGSLRASIGNDGSFHTLGSGIQIGQSSNPWLTLHSLSSGSDGVDQGGGISIGESGKKGSAAVHLTYTGNGRGHLGMGAVDSTGIPEYEVLEMHYQSNSGTFKGNLIANGNIYSNGSNYYGDGKNILQFSDSWLRLNPSGNFTTGIYCGNSLLRTDGSLQVGNSPVNFTASSSGINLNSTVTFNAAFNGKINVSSTNLRSSGMYGIYDSNRIGHIWSMGTSFSIPDDGSDFGNLYGLAYKHTNNPTGGSMAGGHQMVWVSNGVPKSAIGTNIWTAGNVYASHFFETSDKSLKHKITPLKEGIKTIKKINTYNYKWKSDDTDDIGVIAQEIEKELPQLVNTNEEGIKSVNYTKLIPILINAIKEQQQQIDGLNNEIKEIKNR